MRSVFSIHPGPPSHPRPQTREIRRRTRDRGVFGSSLSELVDDHRDPLGDVLIGMERASPHRVENRDKMNGKKRRKDSRLTVSSTPLREERYLTIAVGGLMNQPCQHQLN